MSDDHTVSDDFLRILRETEHRVRRSCHGHWASTNRLETVNRVATIVTLVGGFLVSVLAALPVLFDNLYKPHAVIISGAIFILGGLVSTVSILQAVQRWGERSQNHLNAANAYETMRRKLEILRLNLPGSAPELSVIINDLILIGETEPPVPENLWRKATKAVLPRD